MTTIAPFPRGESTEPVPDGSDFQPARVFEVELGRALPAVAALDEATGRRYRRAMAFVRLHTQPLGVVELRLAEHGLTAAEHGQQIWQALRAEIAEHLRQDGLPAPLTLDAAGLPCINAPHCTRERERLRADAPFVSVIVPTHDRAERLATCLRSLLALQYPCYEIVVVDNAPSTDATADMVRQIHGGSARVRYVREERLGKSWAYNCGLAEARGETLAFTDDDVVVDTYWLAELVKGFSAAENVGCVTGMICPVELETPAQLWVDRYCFGKGFARRIFDLDKHRPKSRLYPFTPGVFGAGANFAVRKSVLRAIGEFDPALGPGTPARGGEELAVFTQVVMGGYRLVYEPASIVHHLHYREYAMLRRQVYGYGVGLTAYLTKCLFDNPLLVSVLAARVPYGLFFILNSRSAKNRKKLAHYPQELTTVERKGMFHGPVAFLRGRRQAAKLRQRCGQRHAADTAKS
jgi:glycosyltransferase involved in cell wall biosynthesis